MLKYNDLSENYSMTEMPDYLIVNKTSNESGILQKITFRINKKRLGGLTLNDPHKLFNQISELWKKK
jgi:hypothetical protein